MPVWLGEQYNLAFYLQYLVKWPEYFTVSEAPDGTLMGYGPLQTGLGGRPTLLLRFDGWGTRAERPGGRACGRTVMGKAEGKKQEWHGHVTALTVAPEFRRLGLADYFMRSLEEVSEKMYGARVRVGESAVRMALTSTASDVATAPPAHMPQPQRLLCGPVCARLEQGRYRDVHQVWLYGVSKSDRLLLWLKRGRRLRYARASRRAAARSRARAHDPDRCGAPRALAVASGLQTCGKRCRAMWTKNRSSRSPGPCIPTKCTFKRPIGGGSAFVQFIQYARTGPHATV